MPETHLPQTIDRNQAKISSILTYPETIWKNGWKIGKDRPTQRLLITTVTDTAFRICGDRLTCPNCPENYLTLQHLIHECPSLERERRDANLYTKKSKNRPIDYARTNLYINFCAAAKNKLTTMIKRARATHPSQQTIHAQPIAEWRTMRQNYYQKSQTNTPQQQFISLTAKKRTFSYVPFLFLSYTNYYITQ